MKTKLLIGFLLVAALAGAGGWFASQHWKSIKKPDSPNTSSGRKILYYQSAMHPWIKSDKPGKCTICGMELVPVYEGEKGFETAAGLVTLNSNSISVINIQTAEVRRQPLQRTLRVAGVIEDDDTRHRILSAYVDGRIEKLSVNYVGAEVEQNQPLATLYSPTLLATEREYVTASHQAGSVQSSELRKINEELLASASLRLRQMGLSDPQIAELPHKKELGLSTDILATMSGTVVARHAYEGQYVKQGDNLFEIGDFSIMWFQFDAYERDLAWLQVGQRVDVTTPSVPGETFAGKVTFIDPNLKETTRSAKVRVEIPNPLIQENGHPRRKLLHKLFAEGMVKVDRPEVLTVPRTAVLSPGQQALVYVDKQGGSYEQRRVKLGLASDERWEVLGGLSEGERVVTTGNLLIDAQAQLDQSSRSVPPLAAQPATNTDAALPLSAPQRDTVRSFLALAEAVTKALSDDQPERFNEQAAKLHAALPELLKAFEEAKAWHPLLEKIEATGHLEPAADLAAARKEFLPFSQAVADLVRHLRAREPEFRTLKIYQCPMVTRAVPGAPPVGFWMQTQAPLRNPFFGATMIDCGTEVAP